MLMLRFLLPVPCRPEVDQPYCLSSPQPGCSAMIDPSQPHENQRTGSIFCCS